jgi:hypothetical protein
MASRRLISDSAWGEGPGNRLRALTQPRHSDARLSVDPVAESVLSLQATAGNAAIAGALLSASPSVQRQPKKPPPHVAAGQAALKQLFPKEKLLEGVVVKDYAELNVTLQGATSYGAWTQSSTAIYVKDPARMADTPAKQAMALRYVLQHEANHVRQFEKTKGPPKTWEAMINFEIEAYRNDLQWLSGPGKSIVTDAKLHKKLVDSATKNLGELRGRVNGAKKQKLEGEKREEFFVDGLLDKDLIPPDSTANPLDLYRQP